MRSVRFFEIYIFLPFQLNSLLDVFFLLCTHTCMNIFQFCATDVIYILQYNRRGQSYIQLYKNGQIYNMSFLQKHIKVSV
jgi:hypothetical protein